MSNEYADAYGDELTDNELHDMFDQMLDECYTLNEVAGLQFDPSKVLRVCDPNAYRCGFNDWVDAELRDGNLIEL